jgi:hypothetical protein
VSIAQDLRTRRKHRGKTPWQLVQTIGRLEHDADERTCQMVAMATENDELRADRNRLAEELDKAALDYSSLLGDRDEWREQALALWERFGPQIAAEENATAVTVPPMQRDTTAIEDQATQPIPVLHLPDAAAAGLLGPVLDPGQP